MGVWAIENFFLGPGGAATSVLAAQFESANELAQFIFVDQGTAQPYCKSSGNALAFSGSSGEQSVVTRDLDFRIQEMVLLDEPLDAVPDATSVEWIDFQGAEAAAIGVCGLATKGVIFNTDAKAADGSSKRFAVTKDMDTTGGENLRFTFVLGAGSATDPECNSAEPDLQEEALVQYSTDRGATWVTFASVLQAAPKLYTIPIAGVLVSTTLRFRFIQLSYSTSISKVKERRAKRRKKKKR